MRRMLYLQLLLVFMAVPTQAQQAHRMIKNNATFATYTQSVITAPDIATRHSDSLEVGVITRATKMFEFQFGVSYSRLYEPWNPQPFTRNSLIIQFGISLSR